MNRITKILLSTLLAVILLLGFAVPVNMVGNWYQQFMPNLNNQPISDIFFLDSLTGWAVTGNNTPNDSNFILKTTNAGDNWQIKLIAYRDFFRIKFINQNTGFVCGGFNSLGNILFKSTNGGDNWFVVNTPSVVYADDFSALNEDTLWFVEHDGLEGGVFRTINGSTNWTRTNLQTLGGNPNKIYMYDRNIGFASSSTGGSLYNTTNGGENWTRITGADGFTDMRFVDSLTGYKCRSFVKKTTDGGITWVQQTLPSGGNIIGSGMSKITYVSTGGDTLWGISGEIIIGSGTRGTLYHTVNGGVNWTFQLPDTSIHIVQYNSGIFTNRYFGWNYAATTTGIHTTNGGDTDFISLAHQISTGVPKEFTLFQNYPNPFNPATKIKFEMSKPGYAELRVFDISGKIISVLLKQRLNIGTYETEFDGNNLSSGVYFYQLIVNEQIIDTKKLILLK